MGVPAVARDVRHRRQDAGGGKQQWDVRKRRDQEERDESQLLRRGVVTPELKTDLKDEGVPADEAEHDDRRHVSLVRNEQGNRHCHCEVGASRDAGDDPLALVHLASTALPCLADESLG
jgi:hypothetical protein